LRKKEKKYEIKSKVVSMSLFEGGKKDENYIPLVRDEFLFQAFFSFSLSSLLLSLHFFSV
jgi:hypothetical protein